MVNAQQLTRVSRTEMARDIFRGYGPMDKHEVRQADTQGTEIERLRARRQLLRSMDPEQALQVIEFHKDLNLFQALELAKREGKLIVPNDVHDRILAETKDEEYLKQNYPLWTGTLIIYEKPDVPFGDQVIFQGLTFTVPEQFRGRANCALVVEHPDFDLVDLGKNTYKIKLVDGANIYLIENFPKNSNIWYNYDKRFRIPIGEESKHAEEDYTRNLWREDIHCISFIRRAFGTFNYGRRRGIVACDRLFDVFEVALF